MRQLFARSRGLEVITPPAMEDILEIPSQIQRHGGNEQSSGLNGSALPSVGIAEMLERPASPHRSAQPGADFDDGLWSEYDDEKHEPKGKWIELPRREYKLADFLDEPGKRGREYAYEVAREEYDDGYNTEDRIDVQPRTQEPPPLPPQYLFRQRGPRGPSGSQQGNVRMISWTGMLSSGIKRYRRRITESRVRFYHGRPSQLAR